MVSEVAPRKKIFMLVLYNETKYINKSMYRRQNATRNISWVLYDRPTRVKISKNVGRLTDHISTLDDSMNEQRYCKEVQHVCDQLKEIHIY